MRYNGGMKYLLLLLLLIPTFAHANDKLSLDYLSMINNMVNQYTYIDEPVDYWKTPREFYADGGGDCEDYTIAKFYLLKDSYDVSILGLRGPGAGLHAVLLVNEKYVLDNMTAFPEVYTYQELQTRAKIIYMSKVPDDFYCALSELVNCYAFNARFKDMLSRI